MYRTISVQPSRQALINPGISRLQAQNLLLALNYCSSIYVYRACYLVCSNRLSFQNIFSSKNWNGWFCSAVKFRILCSVHWKTLCHLLYLKCHRKIDTKALTWSAGWKLRFFFARAFPRLKILVPNVCTLENCSKKGGRLSVRIAAPDTNYERAGDALSHKAQRPYRSTRHSETCLWSSFKTMADHKFLNTYRCL